MASAVWQTGDQGCSQFKGSKIWTRDEEEELVKAVQSLRGYGHVNGDMLWVNILNTKNFPNRSMIDLKNQFLSKVLPNIRSYVDSKEAGKFKTANKNGSNFGGNKQYTADEKGKIIKGILRYTGRVVPGGVKMWQDIEAKVPGRSWQSIKEHFKKHIQPNLDRLGLKPELLQALKERLGEQEILKQKSDESMEVDISSEQDNSDDDYSDQDAAFDDDKRKFLYGSDIEKRMVRNENLELMNQYGKEDSQSTATTPGSSKNIGKRSENSPSTSTHNVLKSGIKNNATADITLNNEVDVNENESLETGGKDEDNANARMETSKTESNKSIKTKETNKRSCAREANEATDKNKPATADVRCLRKRSKVEIGAKNTVAGTLRFEDDVHAQQYSPTINANAKMTSSKQKIQERKVDSVSKDDNLTKHTLNEGPKKVNTSPAKDEELSHKMNEGKAKTKFKGPNKTHDGDPDVNATSVIEGTKNVSDNKVMVTNLDQKIASAQKCVAYILEQANDPDKRVRDAAEAALFSLVESRKHIKLLKD